MSVEKQVALSEHDVSCVAELVLLADVDHVEVLLVVETEVLAASVEVSEGGQREEGPHHELFDHYLASHHSEEASGRSVERRSDVAIVDVFPTYHIGPVPLSWRLVLIGLPIKKLLLDEVHPQNHGCLMLLRNAAVRLIEVVEVIRIARLQLVSQ